MTLAPLTIRPVSAVFTVQPTPEPWSARQAQMWSMSVLLLLITRLFVALPGPAPPMRKKTSWTDGGLDEWLAEAPPGPIVSSVLELTVPASKSRPAIFTPLRSPTGIALH